MLSFEIELGPEEFKKILDLVHLWTGITLGESKKTLVQGRLRPRLKILGLTSYKDYFLYLQENKGEQQEFINLITTNETSFFRTNRVWDYFRTEFLEKWDQKAPLKIWSAASSTGEEAYSLAMSCEEHRLKKPSFDYEIFASDISSKVVNIAQKGEYAGRSIDSFKQTHPTLFNKFFHEGKVERKLKEKIHFSTHNLFHQPFKKDYFDIVFLRNVLIYFELKDQERVLQNIALSLKKDGILIIGESESLNSMKTSFEYIKPLVYIKRF